MFLEMYKRIFALLFLCLGVVVCQEAGCSNFVCTGNLHKKLLEMEVRMDAMQKLLDAQNNANGAVSNNGNKGTSNVAFSAFQNPERITYNAGDIVQFDKVYTNIGSGFDASTGTFTAPVDGTYVFMTHILSDNDEEVWAHIDINHTTYARLYARGTDRRHDMGSQSLVINLKEGDAVTVQNSRAGGEYYGIVYSSFSGILLFGG